MATTGFSRHLRLASHNNTTEAEMFSPNSISVQTKHRPPSQSENRGHRLDPEQRSTIKTHQSGDDDYDVGDEGEDDDDEDEDDEYDGDDRDDVNYNDQQNDIMAQFGDPTIGINDTTNLQDCIDALDSVIEQVPSYHIYSAYQNGGGINNDTSSKNLNNHQPITHQGRMDNQNNNNNNNHHTISSDLDFDQQTLYNYSGLDCFIVHPELIHPQIHDPILHHHTSSTSLSYSLLDSFDVSPNDVQRIMESVVGDNEPISDVGDIARNNDRYFVKICYGWLC